LDLRTQLGLQTTQNVAVTQLVSETTLKFPKLLLYPQVLVVSFLKGALVKLFFFVDVQDLVLFAGQNLSQLRDAVASLAKSHALLSGLVVRSHRDEVMQSELSLLRDGLEAG